MIAMTRPVHIANTPIQSLSRGFPSGSLAGAKGGAKDGRSSALVVGARATGGRRARRTRCSVETSVIALGGRFGRDAVDEAPRWAALAPIASSMPTNPPATPGPRSPSSRRAASVVEPPRPRLRSQVPTSTALLVAGLCESRDFETRLVQNRFE